MMVDTRKMLFLSVGKACVCVCVCVCRVCMYMAGHSAYSTFKLYQFPVDILFSTNLLSLYLLLKFNQSKTGNNNRQYNNRE